MTNHRSLKALLFLPLVFLAAAAGAQTLPIEIEAGYRWSDVSGNENLYRTQIDERSGFLVRSLSFFTNAGADHVRIEATDLGAGPASAFRIETGRPEIYRLRLGYRDFDTFSALPTFALGQHTFDRNRTLFDADLEIFPDRKITPFVGYSRGTYKGPGTSTYTIGGDEFLLGQDIDERESEIRAGAAFNFGVFYGSLTQGWRTLDSDETLTLAPGAGGGNGTGSIFGTNPSASTLTRRGSTSVDTPFTNAYATAEFTPRLHVVGSYSRFEADSDGVDDETAIGNFVSFGISRKFTGFVDDVTSKAKNKTWRGSARAEFALTDRLDLLAGYRSDHRELSGDALLRSIYVDTTTFTGLDTGDIEELLDPSSVLDRDVDTLEAAISARALGPFSVRAGFSQSKFDYGVSPSAEEIVVPGSQGGDFERKVNTFDVSATYSKALFSLGAAYRRDDADDAVIRTDYLNRDRLRVRAGFHTPNNLFRVGVMAEDLNQDNDENGTGFDANARSYTADAEVAPHKAVRVRGAYTQLRSDSSVVIRRPETFALETSEHREDGDVYELGLGLLLSQFTVDVGASRYENTGTLPFDSDRYRARVVYDFLSHAGVAAEWARDKYDEQTAAGQFDADRFGLFLRYRP